MRSLQARRIGARLLATVLTAAISLVALAACGGDNQGRDGRTPRSPRGESTPAETTPTASPSVDPSGTTSPTTPLTPPPTTTAPPSAPPATPKPKSVKITITAGEVKGAPDRLKVSAGDTVKIMIESDVADELHVHGVEQTLALPAGEKVALEFVVLAEVGPGVYAVELHSSGFLLFALEVR